MKRKLSIALVFAITFVVGMAVDHAFNGPEIVVRPIILDAPYLPFKVYGFIICVCDYFSFHFCLSKCLASLVQAAKDVSSGSYPINLHIFLYVFQNWRGWSWR